MNRITKILFSEKLSVVLLALIAILLGGATLIEKYFSTATAKECVYFHPGFIVLWGVSLLNMVGVLIRSAYLRRNKIGIQLLHGSFILILLGAAVTHWYSYEGIIHIREGERSNRLIMADKTIRELPFAIGLTDFRLIRYPGSKSPSSYESDLQIHVSGSSRDEHIRMNKVVYEQGFRLYQSSFDLDECGTVLTVNFDPYGTVISYLGYLVLAFGIIVVLLGKGSRFRLLMQRLPRSAWMIGLMFLFSAVSLNAQSSLRYVPISAHADVFGSVLVQCPSGRIEPMNTYSSKLLRKIYRSSDYEGLSSEQVLLGIVLYPEYWNGCRIFKQTNEEIDRLLGTSGGYVAFQSLFDESGKYRLAQLVEEGYSKKPNARNGFDKDVLKLDEKANIWYALQQGEYMKLFPLPNDPEHHWYAPGDDLSRFSGRDSSFVANIFSYYLQSLHESIEGGDYASSNEVVGLIATYQKRMAGMELMSDERIDAEVFYNRMGIFSKAAMGYLALSIVLLILSVIWMIRPNRVVCLGLIGVEAAILLLFLFHTFGIGLRWYISGQAPWSNSYESMVHVAWAAVFVGLFFFRRSPLTMALSALMGGAVLLVSHLNFMDPEITPLVPVLKSPWLMVHVASITTGYGLFGVSLLLGLLVVVLELANRRGDWSDRISELRTINEISVTVGLLFLTAGTFLGAVWANESWGRYWGWDPKETWALITMLAYALVLHARFIRLFSSHLVFSILSVFAFSSVLMTYFGVNYFLSGMHSYGRTDTPPMLDVIYWFYGFFALLAMVAVVVRQRRI